MFVPTQEQIDAYAQAPDAFVSGLAIEGDGYRSVVPEGWEEYFPTHSFEPDQAIEPQSPGARPKRRNKSDGSSRTAKLSEEAAKKIQSQLVASRGVGGLRKIMNKYDSDKDGMLRPAELKRLIRKELKFDPAVKEPDIEMFVSALDHRQGGFLSIDETLNFLQGRGTPTQPPATPPVGTPQEDEEQEEPERSSSRAQADRDEEGGDGDGSEEDGKKLPPRNADGAVAQGSSKTASLALANGSHTLMFLPLGNHFHQHFITRAATPRKTTKARKEPVQKIQKKGKDEETSTYEAGESDSNSGKPFAKTSKYWLRGGGSRASPQPAPATPRAVRRNGGSPQASKRPQTVGAEPGSSKAAPKQVMAGKFVFQPQVGLPGQSPALGYLTAR